MQNEIIKERFEQISKLGNERDNFLDGWLRWLVLIASGCLSILIPLSNIYNQSIVAKVFFKFTCVFIGIGIIMLAVRIYAIYHEKKSVIKELAKNMNNAHSYPVTSSIPKWMLLCEKIGYISLILSLCSLIALACIH